MTDKQIDINNQVEVGLNIAKELLELHKMFEDEVEKSPYFIQTNFIKNKLFYFYQRADWLNVCFNLLDKQLDQLKAELEQEKNWHKSADEISKVNSEYTVKLKAENKELKKANIHIDNNRMVKADKLKRIEDLIIACSSGYTDEFIQELLVILHEPEPIKE